MDADLIAEQATPSGHLNRIVFDLMTNGEIEKLCNVGIMEVNDVTSSKLGLPNACSQCETCGSRYIKDCDGHSGFLKLPKVIYHPYFMTEVVHILNHICPGCKRVKKDLQMKGSFILEATEEDIKAGIYFLEAFSKNLTALQRKLLKTVNNSKVGFIKLKCSKFNKNWSAKDAPVVCKYCTRNEDGWYPSVKFKISSKDILARAEAKQD